MDSQSSRQSPLPLFFFFQAEDGIRDADVTGVQTCALPISGKLHRTMLKPVPQAHQVGKLDAAPARLFVDAATLIKERHLDVLDDGVLRQQVVRLKDEAEILAADFGKAIVLHA